jgi:hypothetical protein
MPKRIGRRVRLMLNLDYGRIDFVMNKGEPVVLDVNKTQGGGAALDPNREQLKKIALGIGSFLK